MTNLQDSSPKWRQMDAQTRADAYSPSKALPDGDLMPFIHSYIEKSAAAYAAFPDVKTLRYGPKPANTIDVVVPNGEGPHALHMFIHGGYWQQLSKRESFFPAFDTLGRGIGFAAVDYTLAPNATLNEIVAECIAAVGAIHQNAASLGIDPDQIVLTGSSAGAHLAAMCCLKLPSEHRPKAVVLMSGVFELEPLIGTYINDAVGMDLNTAIRNSPMLHNLADFPPSVIAWGRLETDEFKRQSQYFAGLLAGAGRQVETIEMEHRNHFDIVEDIANTSELGRKMAGLVRGQGVK